MFLQPCLPARACFEETFPTATKVAQNTDLAQKCQEYGA